MKVLAIALAFGDLYEDNGKGELKIPHDGAIDRFHCLVKNLPSNSECKFCCSAGFAKRSPLRPVPERSVSLADQLNRYVRENYPDIYELLHTSGVSWGTRREISDAIFLAKLSGYKKDDEVKVLIASHPAHLFRVKICAKQLMPKNWELVLLKSKHRFSLRDKIYEIPKIVKDLLWLKKKKKSLETVFQMVEGGL